MLLKETAERFPDRPAVTDGSVTMSWHELYTMANQIGQAVKRRVTSGSPVPVIMDKSPEMLAVMLGVACAGCFYVPVSPQNPGARMKKILDTLDPSLIIGGRDILEKHEEISSYSNMARKMEELLEEQIDGGVYTEAEVKETDILYGIFTSGSTGVPKAVVVSHGAALRFIRHFVKIARITEKDRIGNQAPFDFDVSVKDIYSAVMTGACIVLIRKELFSSPPKLLDYLCGQQVTVLTWAVSALTLISSLRGLNYRVPKTVRIVMFSGETMPPKQLRMWQDALPDAVFINLYGPTEATCNCTFYKVKRKFNDGEKIPVGKPFPERCVYLIDEEGNVIRETNRQGELCVSGESLSEGYYRNPEQTAAHFVERKTEDGHVWRTYRTGDLAYYDENRNLVFAGRKDFQIKHMGHRIELEEIETAMCAADGIEKSCCVFDKEKGRLYGFYMGSAEPAEVRSVLKQKLPVWMIPSRFYRTESMPLNKNGKTDRKYFINKAETEKGKGG